jgi:myosin regulatory light chain 12
MGQRLIRLDAEHDLLEAFASFDEGDKGWVKVDEVRRALAELGDRMDAAEVSGSLGLYAQGGRRRRGAKKASIMGVRTTVSVGWYRL